MFSKFSRSLACTTLNNSKARFSSLKKSLLQVFNRPDLSDSSYKIATFNPVQPLANHKLQYRQDQAPNYEVTKLKNGITVVTESLVFPNVVDMGILLDLGVRDETHESSGALFSIKNTYYKTVINTNETINYGMVQMSGGNFEMDYDYENTYFKAHCLSHDVVDIFNMVADCALEPRSVVAANVAMEKGQYEHSLEELVDTGKLLNDKIMKTAFGNHGLGNTLVGDHHNVKYLNAHVLQKFQFENITPEKIIVAAAGVENHQEFVELVESKLGFIPASQGQGSQRHATEYLGGELRNQTDDNDITIALAFRSAPWGSKDIFALQILNALLGNSSSHNPAALGAGILTRTNQNLLSKHTYLDSAHTLNYNFSDAGLFGITVKGSASNANEILEATTSELKGLTNSLNKDEFERAKTVAKASILTALERQSDRLEEAAKNVKVFGKVVHNHYADQIESVTHDQVSSIISAILSSKPTLVVEGGEANRLPSYDRIQNLLKH